MEATIKDLMIPADEYVTVDAGDTLFEYFAKIDKDRQEKGAANAAHHAALVTENGTVLGMVTMIDIYLALEPSYKNIVDSETESSMLTPDYIAEVYRKYDLWAEPLKNMCAKAARLTMRDIMYNARKAETVKESDSLNLALHHFALGAHHPLLVCDASGKVTGLLRYGEVFEYVKSITLQCEL